MTPLFDDVESENTVEQTATLKRPVSCGSIVMPDLSEPCVRTGDRCSTEPLTAHDLAPLSMSKRPASYSDIIVDQNDQEFAVEKAEAVLSEATELRRMLSMSCGSVIMTSLFALKKTEPVSPTSPLIEISSPKDNLYDEEEPEQFQASTVDYDGWDDSDFGLDFIEGDAYEADGFEPRFNANSDSMYAPIFGIEVPCDDIEVTPQSIEVGENPIEIDCSLCVAQAYLEIDSFVQSTPQTPKCEGVLDNLEVASAGWVSAAASLGKTEFHSIEVTEDILASLEAPRVCEVVADLEESVCPEPPVEDVCDDFPCKRAPKKRSFWRRLFCCGANLS